MKNTSGFLPVLTFLFFFHTLPLAFSLEVHTYDQLLHAIRETRQASVQRVEEAVEREKVREVWETGKLIDEHILFHKERADYDQEVMTRLSKDLGVSESELYRMLKFARLYPSILAAPPELAWSHIRELMPVEDAEKRKEIAAEAAKKGWSNKELRQEIKKRKLASADEEGLELPESKPGKLGVYRVVERNGKNYYDLGFETFIEAKGRIPEQIPAPENLFTYEAEALNVIDGDTFYARIRLGFGIIMEKRLRFQRVDAPEIESAEGKKAKAELEKILAEADHKIIIKAFGEDQHGRPLIQAWANAQSLEQALLNSGVFTTRENK